MAVPPMIVNRAPALTGLTGMP